MADWLTVVCNSNLIQVQTDKAYLIKLPKSEFKFWHPAKLCKLSGTKNYRLSISYTKDFTFKCFRNGEGKYNQRDIIESKELSPEEFVSYFSK